MSCGPTIIDRVQVLCSGAGCTAKISHPSGWIDLPPLDSIRLIDLSGLAVISTTRARDSVPIRHDHASWPLPGMITRQISVRGCHGNAAASVLATLHRPDD